MSTQHIASLVVKSDEVIPLEKRLAFAEVYAPLRPDSHGEYMTADEIEKMAHKFARDGRLHHVDQQHDNKLTAGVEIVESFIARKGDPDFIEGSWVVGIHIPDDDTWEKVKKGELNGLSMEALVIREEKEVELTIPPVVTGWTSKSEDHEHRFYVSYVDGVFAGGVTDVVDGHKHVIKSGTVTEKADDHNHRFSSVDEILITE